MRDRACCVTLLSFFAMDLPCDMIELVGSKLPSRDLAAFCQASRNVARIAGNELAKRRSAILNTFKAEVSKASKVLKTQVLRSMIRQLDSVPELESGEFPQFNALEGSVIILTAMPEWSFAKTIDGWLEATLQTSCGVEMRASVAYGNTHVNDTYPDRQWLGACISNVELTSPSGDTLGKWISSRPWAFRIDNAVDMPTDFGFVENDVGMFWMEPSDLVAPMSGTGMYKFPPWWGVLPQYEDHVRIVDEELRDDPNDDNPAAQVFAAWRDSAIVLLDRYRTRSNYPDDWKHTGYVVVTPDWMNARFPDADIFDAFERALGPSWTVEKNASFRTVYARKPWRSGELVATYDVEANWRDVRFHDGKITAIFRCEAPGLTCTIMHDAVSDSRATTDDVKEFTRLAESTGMPVMMVS